MGAGGHRLFVCAFMAVMVQMSFPVVAGELVGGG